MGLLNELRKLGLVRVTSAKVKRTMFKKIKLGSAVTALVLFAFPWIDIQCSGKSVWTQSGFQVIYGGFSPSGENRAFEEKRSSEQSFDSEISMGFAPLIGFALLAVIGAVIYSSIALFRGGARAELLSSVLPMIALGLLLFQLMIGFPVKNKISEAMSESSSEIQSEDDEFDALAKSMDETIMMLIRVQTTSAFYLEVLALGIPTLLLVNGLIDKYKKSEPGGAGNA